MTRYLLNRLLWGVVSILVLATLVFFGVHLLIPYDFATQFRLADVEIWSLIREELGLNRPVFVQWLEYMGGLLRGDLGVGFDQVPVTPRVLAALPMTAALFAVGGLVAYLLGEWVGRVVAWQKSRVVAGSMTSVSVFMYTLFPIWLVIFLGAVLGPWNLDLRTRLDLPPIFPGVPVPPGPTYLFVASLIGCLLATVLVQGWARRTGRRFIGVLAFPVSLLVVGSGLSIAGVVRDVLDIALRPSFVVASIAVVILIYGEVMLVMRTGMSLETREDYVLTARAKGLTERSVRDRHVARNAVVPSLARFIAGVPFLLAGTVIVEAFTGWAGVSNVFLLAINTANIPLVVGTMVMVGVLGVVVRILLDVVQAGLDPRTRAPWEAG